MQTIIVPGSDLSAAAKLLKTCITKKVYLPVLQHVAVIPGNGALTLRATDMELFAELTMAADADAGIRPFTLPAADLLDAAKLGKKGNVRLYLNDVSVTAEAAGVKTSIDLRDLDYPSFPAPAADAPAVMVSLSTLRGMLDHAALAVADDATKPTLSAICLDVKDAKLHAVGTDGFRLAVATAETDLVPDTQLIVVPRVLSMLPKHSAAYNPAVQIQWDDLHVFFSMPGAVLAVRRVQGRYPAWHKVIPATFPQQLKVDRARFVSALKAVKVKSDKYNRNVELIAADGNMLVRFTHPETGAAECSIPADGPAITFAFNLQYLLDAVDHFEAHDVTLEYISDAAQVNLNGAGFSSFSSLYILMPVKFSR